MNTSFSYKKCFNLTLLGYIIIGAASSGFYQQRYFHEESLAPFVWISFGLIGSILLVAKNIFGSDNKLHSACVDICFILPTVLIPLIPARYDMMLMLMLVYVCVFIVLYVFKNYKRMKMDT